MCSGGSEMYTDAGPIGTIKYLAYHFSCGLLPETDGCVNLYLKN
jgi:hypothetical protein